ncbi:MAG: hypothetical protein AB1714_11155 [Acidobacteriota bacterium]
MCSDLKRVARGVLLLFGLATCPLHAQPTSPNLVANPGFETDIFSAGSGWTFTEGPVPIWDRQAHDGQHSLFISAAYSAGRPVSQRIDGIRMEAPYLFTCWIARSVVNEGNYASFRLLGHPVRADDVWARDRWQKFTYLVPRAVDSEIRIEVEDAEQGGYHFDDISLTEITLADLSPADGAEVDAPRFAWLVDAGDRVVRFELEISESQGFERRTSEALLSAQGPPYEPAAPLRAGSYYWRFRAFHGKEEIAVSGLRRFRLTRDWEGKPGAPPQPPRTIPIGIFASSIEVQQLAHTPIKWVVTSASSRVPTETLFKNAKAAGLRLVLSNHGTVSEIDAAPKLAARHPELAGWYIADEPEGRATPPIDLVRRFLAIKSATPQLPAAIALLRPWRAADYAVAADAIMADPYPVPHLPIALLGQSIDTARASSGTEKPIWAVIQAFNWSDIYEGPDPSIRGRAPTEPELRALAYSALVHGARGIFFYNLSTARRCGVWDDVKRVAEKLTADLPLFETAIRLPDRPLWCDDGDGLGGPAIHSASFDLRLSCGKAWPAGRYVVAVNTTGLPARASDRPQPITSDGPAPRTTFGPFEIRIIRETGPGR